MVEQASQMPIVVLDLVGFSAHSSDEQRLILEILQDCLKKAAQFIAPFVDFWKKWARHGTGDGYYLFLDEIDVAVALCVATNFDEAVRAHNEANPELILRFRMVLAYGSVQMVGDQYHGEALITASRLLDGPELKAHEVRLWTERGITGGLATTGTFMVALRRSTFPGLPPKQMDWVDFVTVDKHEKVHKGKLWAKGLESGPFVAAQTKVHDPAAKTLADEPGTSKASKNPKVIYLAYAEADKDVAKQLKKLLSIYQHDHDFTLWDSNEVGSGLFETSENERALARSFLAVILVSVDYLDDKKSELGQILQRVKGGELKPGWLQVRPCPVVGKLVELKQYRELHRSDEPLSERSANQREKILTEVAKTIFALISSH